MTDNQEVEATVQILSIDECPEGGALITFDVDQNLIDAYKKNTGKKRATKKGLSKFLLEIIKESINERYK